MNKGLEALKRVERDMEYVTRLDFVEPIVRGEVQQELYKIYHREEKDLDIIEKELKALEIIRNKGIHCGYVKRTENLSDYNANVPFREELTQEEYNLLKEVLL